jgi:ferric-dicitrate binding protein FerR (iron transport regulator)
MTTTSPVQGLVELDPAALALAAAPDAMAEEAPAPLKRPRRKSVLALSVCAIAINGAAAIYTWPSDFREASIGSMAELLLLWHAAPPKPDPVLAALKDIQAAQQQHTAALQESNRLSQQNAALQQQDSMVMLSLRQSITDERVDVRKMSSQLSTLIAKIDSLQGAMMSDVTSSIRKAHARYGLSAALRKRLVREPKSVGPVSVGGAPLSMPATVAAPES